jgi:hypothetical protein
LSSRVTAGGGGELVIIRKVTTKKDDESFLVKECQCHHHLDGIGMRLGKINPD